MGPSTARVECREATGFREVTLRNRHFQLTVLPEVGCHWWQLSLSAAGEWHELLLPTPVQALTTGRGLRGSYVLAPWSNRVVDGRFEYAGETYTLRPNYPDGTSIHGDVRLRPWQVEVEDDQLFEATLATAEAEEFNFPFALGFRQRFRLAGERLSVEFEIENRDRRRAPVGVGYHPYFRRRLTSRDRDLYVRVPAGAMYPLEDCVPTGPAVRVDAARDLQVLGPLGDRELNDCLTELSEREFRLIYPGTGVEVRLTASEEFGHVVVYSPRGDKGEPSEFLAVEPVSHVTDGFNRLARGDEMTGVQELDPGEVWRTEWSLTVGDI